MFSPGTILLLALPAVAPPQESDRAKALFDSMRELQSLRVYDATLKENEERLRAGKWGEARDALLELVPEDERSPHHGLLLGNLLFEMDRDRHGEWRFAASLLSTRLLENPEDPLLAKAVADFPDEPEILAIEAQYTPGGKEDVELIARYTAACFGNGDAYQRAPVGFQLLKELLD